MTQPCHYALTILLVQSQSLFGQTEVPISLTHRIERSWEDDTLLVRQVCLSVLYLAWCCISSATQLWSTQSHSRLEVCFAKDRKSTGRMSYHMLGGRAVHFQIISKPAEKYMKQGISMNSMHCMNIVYSPVWSWIIFEGTAVKFFPRKGIISFLGTCRLLFPPGNDPECRLPLNQF